MAMDEKQPFLSHLEELRQRLIYIAIALGVGFGICYFFAEELFLLLVLPLKANLPEGDRLIFTNLPEMFFTYLKCAFVGGILLVSPVIREKRNTSYPLSVPLPCSLWAGPSSVILSYSLLDFGSF